MAKRSKESEPSEPEPGVVPMEEPVENTPPTETRPALPPPPPRVPPEAPPRTTSGPGFGSRVGGFFRFLFRLMVLLLFLGLLSLVLYLTLPWLYQRFIRPVEQNTVQVRQLQTRQEQTEQELEDLQSRLKSIEAGQSQNGESFTELDQRLSEIEEEISARTESLETLEQMLSDLEGQTEANAMELERQIHLLKAMELLSRARLSMYQSNFGLARQDVQIARDLLAEAQQASSSTEAAELDAVLQRLDLTLSNLPAFPVAAADDLDIAWQILLSGLPQPTLTMVATLTSTPVGTVSTPSTAIGTSTPTLVATLPPSATP